MSTANHVFQDPQPLTVKSYTIALDKDEQSLAVPICLRPRVAQANYTWSLFLGAASPDARSGSQGDVWVTTIPRYENVYIRGESDQWNVWHKTINYGEKRYCNDEKKFLHSYHPWLRDRLLQFNGTDLGWHRRRFFNHHRVSWNTTRASGHPEYESLDSVAVARYMKPLHLPRPTLFGRIQPAASTSSFSVPPVTPTARPAQPGHPMLPRPTVPGGVQLAAPSSSYNLQPTTTLPVQQGHTLPTPTVPGGVQPAASTNLPSVTTARPAPLGQPMLPRPAVPRVVQPATRNSSTSFPPVTTALSAQPAQPTLRELTFTGVKVQPAAPASSSSLPTVTTATRPAPPAQPMPPKPTVSGGAQTAAPSLTPKTALPTQLASPLPPEPPKYEDVVSEPRVKRRRSSSSLSYASKERSPSPKRPHLGEKVRDSSYTIREQPPHLSCPRTSALGTPPTSSTLLAATAAPPLAIPPSSAPAGRPSPVPAVQPSPVPAVQPSLAPATQPALVPATATHPLPAPSVRPPPTHPVSPHKPASIAKGVDVPTTPSPLDAETRRILEEAPKKPSPPDPASIEPFLSNLPLSLSHRTAAFTTVGVANMEHLRLLAQLHKCSLDEFLAMLRERGLSFIESLVLRSALHALRQPSADPQAQAEPTTIEAWLERIGPSMVRHARVFQDLGIDIAHIPVLAQLDAESFQEFENALDTAGLAWIDRFVITAQIRDNGLSDSKPEPLLAT